MNWSPLRATPYPCEPNLPEHLEDYQFSPPREDSQSHAQYLQTPVRGGSVNNQIYSEDLYSASPPPKAAMMTETEQKLATELAQKDEKIRWLEAHFEWCNGNHGERRQEGKEQEVHKEITDTKTKHGLKKCLSQMFGMDK